MDDYPILGAFLTVLWFFVMVAWIMTLFQILRDIFRSPDLSGVTKAFWTFGIMIIPVFGALIYLAARGGTMHARDLQESQQREKAVQDYIRNTVAEPPVAAPPVTSA